MTQRELPASTTVMIADARDKRYALLHQRDKAPHCKPNIRCDYYQCKCMVEP